MYTLSTCIHCRNAKQFLNDCGISYEYVDVDRLTGAERTTTIQEVKKYNPACSFPTICIGNKVIVGFNKEEIKAALCMNQVEQIYEVLREAQEPKGYFFNKEKELVYDLLNSLLINKERYGYMCCPCRLASGNRKSDEDIICPCIYRTADVAEYGSCYCNLYVSTQWNEGVVPHVYVPERRPADKLPD